MAKRLDGIPRTLRRIEWRPDGQYNYYLDCGHVVTGPGRATVPAMMKCQECKLEDR
jgi:hypothetical protein